MKGRSKGQRHRLGKSKHLIGFPGGTIGKDAGKRRWVGSLGREDLLEAGLATHSSMLAWRIPWTEEPDRLQSIGS